MRRCAGWRCCVVFGRSVRTAVRTGDWQCARAVASVAGYCVGMAAQYGRLSDALGRRRRRRRRRSCERGTTVRARVRAVPLYASAAASRVLRARRRSVAGVSLHCCQHRWSDPFCVCVAAGAAVARCYGRPCGVPTRGTAGASVRMTTLPCDCDGRPCLQTIAVEASVDVGDCGHGAAAACGVCVGW